MSSLSITGNDQGLVQYYRKLAGNSAAPTVAAPAAASSAVSTTSASADQDVQKGAGGHHHGHGGLFKKIESAVTTALEAAKSDPSADPNKVVQDAIAKVFQDNGGAPQTSGGAAQGGPQSSSDADGDQHAAGQGNGAADSARQAFAQTLQSFGVDPNQFHTDFLAAIQQVQGGGTSDSNSDLFKAFPPGSSVDTTA